MKMKVTPGMVALLGAMSLEPMDMDRVLRQLDGVELLEAEGREPNTMRDYVPMLTAPEACYQREPNWDMPRAPHQRRRAAHARSSWYGGKPASGGRGGARRGHGAKGSHNRSAVMKRAAKRKARKAARR
jgi:hypothetical protein